MSNIQVKSSLFAGEFENDSNAAVRFSTNARLMWSSRKKRGRDYVKVVDTIYGVERDISLPLIELEFLLDYVPFGDMSGCLIGCESKNGIRMLFVGIDAKRAEFTTTGIDCNLNELPTLCHLPEVYRLNKNLLAVEITGIDVSTGQNRLPRLLVLKISDEITLKKSIELTYENRTNAIILWEEKLHYFPSRREFDKMVEVDMTSGESRLRCLNRFPMPTEKSHSVIAQDKKFYIIAFPMLGFFDLDTREWTTVELLKHPHMIQQPSVLCLNTAGNLVVHFHKADSKHRFQNYIYQLQQPESLSNLALIACKHFGLLNRITNQRISLFDDSPPQRDTSKYVKHMCLFSC